MMNFPKRKIRSFALSNCVSVLMLLLAAILLGLAFLPWIISDFNPRSLVPEGLRAEKENYQNTVQTAQMMTSEAQRQATSIYGLRVIGTFVPTEIAGEGNSNGTSEVTISTAILEAQTSEGTSTPFSLVNNPICQLDSDQYVLATPAYMVTIDDELNESQIETQLASDSYEFDFRNITVQINSSEVLIQSNYIGPLGVAQRVEATGQFYVANYSLRVSIQRISIDDLDITNQFCKYLQSGINSSLYRLLPGRYVQSFEAVEGYLTIRSLIRE